jgi:hypothetical protein
VDRGEKLRAHRASDDEFSQSNSDKSIGLLHRPDGLHFPRATGPVTKAKVPTQDG